MYQEMQYNNKKPASGDAGSVLEFLLKQYLEENPVDSERIKEIQNQMAPYFENLDFDNSNRLFSLVYDLCTAYEETAFRKGFSMGVKLRQEIGK